MTIVFVILLYLFNINRIELGHLFNLTSDSHSVVKIGCLLYLKDKHEKTVVVFYLGFLVLFFLICI